MSRAAAYAVAEKLRKKPDAVIMLPTGSTPGGMYRWLIEIYVREGLSFSQATFFNLDEYLNLPPDHPASYRRYMEDNLYCCVDVEFEKVHVPYGITSDPRSECARYEQTIKNAGGIDLCILGIGRNGHIGFNEPGASFDSRTRVVTLDESTRHINAEDFESNLAPEKAITVGMETIFEAREILLLASGINKAAAVAEAAEGPVSVKTPASILQCHAKTTLLLDKKAASNLSKIAG